jgi:peptidoglycan/LPS O-acetylase OafA/YrhL
MATKRFEILDLFRFVAILMVMFYHYFSRWSIAHHTVDLYPYSNKYDFFLWGRMGVQFFFIISGFVIYMTLERASSLLDFAKKRLVRLWPSMLLLSSITFIVFTLFDHPIIFPESHALSNLFYSWTFLGKSMNNAGYKYVDGSYWSLWVEIQFYILSAVLFFILKKINRVSFFPYVLFAMALFVVLLKPVMGAFNEMFNLFLYFNFFVMGVVFKELFRSDQPWSFKCIHWHIMLLFLLLIEWAFFADDGVSRALDGLFIVAFYMFIFFAHRRWVPQHPVFSVFVLFGEASYLSYLMHQNMGVLLINKLAYVGPFDFMVPVGVMALMFVLSAFLYRHFEKPTMAFLKKRFFAIPH